VPGRIKNATKDLPDLRDRIYEPALVRLDPEIAPDVIPDAILDQGYEGACTGFSLAAVINHLNRRAERAEIRVSPRMLYEMAKRFDEWDGEDYEGSSLRGAIRGWKNNGVCQEKRWPYTQTPGYLTVKRAKDARSHTVGAYYRIRPVVSDFHAALNEVGVVAVSAQVHAGWDAPRDGTIPFRKTNDGGHAFALVGYNDKGFWVQNSWGPEWGSNGLAIWTYEDWAKNVMDAWVVRLALPTPQIFGITPNSAAVAEDAAAKKPKAARAEIAGHFVHIDDGGFKEKGRYWSTASDVRQTAELVAESAKFDHFLIYAHGGLNAPDDSARRIRAMKDGYKRNRIYPYHIMYDTGLAEELKDLILNKGSASKARVGGVTDWIDRRIEATARPLGTRVWEEMKKDAQAAFDDNGAGTTALNQLLSLLQRGQHKKTIHLVGHSTGAVVIAHLLHALRNETVEIATCTLLAPACQVAVYEEKYLPALERQGKLEVESLNVLCLSDRLELDDNVALVYRKSLLYLVSNAFERVKERPLLGMEKFRDLIDLAGGKTNLVYSDGMSGNTTWSRSHGGFDNDVTTMNYILKTILGKPPTEPFREGELSY
jgi:pimeloyl-ACP methyl ester carboxylesterase